MRRELLLQASTAVSLALADCGPIAVPITNVTLANNKNRRGVFGAVGTPSQNISFWVHTHLNNTWVYNSTDHWCPGWASDPQCMTLHGGLYDAEASKTSQARSDMGAAGGDPTDTAPDSGETLGLYGAVTDTFTIGDVALGEYPVGMFGREFGAPFNRYANLGLGQNSTILNRLKSEGHIPSRSWSYWYGIDNPESLSDMDGQLVFGGYDKAKITGEPYTGLLQNTDICGSGILISLTHMNLIFPNDTDHDLNKKGGPLNACVATDAPVAVQVPAQPYFWSFENYTDTHYISRSLGTQYYAYVYPRSNVYQGEFQVSLMGGPNITLSNDAFIIPEQTVDSSGEVRANTTAAVSLLGANTDSQAENPTLLVGMNFFSAAYLSVNLEERTFSIWAAEPTTESELVAIGGDKCEGASTDPTTEDSTTQSPSEASDATSDASDVTPLTTGTIAGVVVGTASAVGIVVALVIWFLMKRRARRGKGSPSTSVGPSQYGDVHPIMAGHQHMTRPAGFAELYTGRDLSEMPGDHVKRDFPELPYENVKIPPAYGHDKPSDQSADAFELSSTPRVGSKPLRASKSN